VERVQDGPKQQQEVSARWARLWARCDPFLYLAFAAFCAILAAQTFYRYMLFQTGGEWSAPLDDVFIHFDYARATARGYPFQWSEENGYSSGNTSLTYPFILAFGYWIGFRELSIIAWAALVAVLSVIAFLAVSGRITEPLGRWAKYVLPPAVLSLGALNWTLWSGMENAWHLGIWAGLLWAILRIRDLSEPGGSERSARRTGWLAGIIGALLVLTRPESTICVAAFGIWAGLLWRRREGLGAGFGMVLRVGAPGAIALVLQTAANRVFTGEWSANGAIVKLAINNPYMSVQDKWDQYAFLLEYVVVRNTQHHFSSALPWGWLVPLVALVPLFVRPVRAIAIVLWVQVLGWLAIVSMNGQVRWQNERYTMAAVAWLLLLAGLGIAVLLRWGRPGRFWDSERRAKWIWGLRAAVAVAVASLYWTYQLPNMRDQIWFFGRASRNILDQHVTAGRFLAEVEPRRVLVGDAGALIYASDRPGLDLIGLGGYHDLPFARANVHGLGASVELIERIPPDDRPDWMAIYPSWWGDLPVLFGERQWVFPVAGNVICGGAEKVLYRADWSPLDRGGRPRSLRPDERVIDELDVADLLSERAHDYQFPRPGMGFIQLRILADPLQPKKGLFDAGRIIPNGQVERARIRTPTVGGRLVARTAAAIETTAEVRIDGRPIGRWVAEPEADGWLELSVDIPPGLPAEASLEIAPIEGEWVNHHVWVIGADPGAGVAQGE
jgi:hypothetical protein